VRGFGPSGAAFAAPRRLTRSRGYTDAPRLALDPRGTLHLVYAESRQVMYRNADDAKARPISRPGAGFPAIGTDANGGVYVTYELFPRDEERPRGMGIAVSRDGGRSFSAPETIPGSADAQGAPNGSFQGLLMQKLAVNRHGELAVVNSSLKDGERSRVWLLRASPK